MILNRVKDRALLFLAAAVSDFYIPSSSMSSHKIQSNSVSGQGLSLHLDNVPKLLGCIKDLWAPHCYLVTFKLETDPLILADKVAQSFSRYRQDAIVANTLSLRFTKVWLYTASVDDVIELQVQGGVELNALLVDRVSQGWEDRRSL
jgi:phosphopantothenate-cysteine ligase